MDATREIPSIDVTHSKRASAGSTEVEPTALDQTAQDDTGNDALQLDGITRPATSTEADADKTADNEPADRESTSLDTMEIESLTSGATQHDDAQFEIIRNFFQDMDNQTRQVGVGHDNVKLYADDRTSPTNTLNYGEETMELPGLRKNPDEEEYLTDEDVTEFMGDGVSDAAKRPDVTAGDSEHKLSPEDTTRESSESFNLTSYKNEGDADDDQDFEDFSLVLQDQDWENSDTDSLPGAQDEYDPEGTAELSISEIPEREASTFVNSSATSTSTSPSFDIDKLTNDETVTVEGKTTTRTYAPDNYDRTLLNMSDMDVSRIFAGMKPDSDAVMTPDYAKKVFLSRSGQQKTHYNRIYAAVGVLLLLGVVLSGLYDLQSEEEIIDRGMVSLKRDPMPGIIRSNVRATETQLFAPEVVEADIKALDVIDSVERPGSRPALKVPPDSAEVDKATPGSTDVVPEKAEPAPREATVIAGQANATTSPGKESQPPVAKLSARSAPVKPAVKGSSSFQIEVKNEADRKNQLLNDAYSAYTQGDLASARTAYDKVLQLDDTNRDALLGRAAIYIQDNQYEQAIDIYQQLLVLNPKDSMAITSLITVANLEPYASEEQLKNMIYEHPESAYLYFALGNIFGSQNRWIEAQNAYFEALQYSPGEPNYAYNLAVSLEHIDKPAQAVTYYQKALDTRSRGQATFNSELVVSRIEVLTR